jgi:hypothetical protein
MPIEHAFSNVHRSRRPAAAAPGTGADAMFRTLWHYTTAEGLSGILATRQLNPSLKERDPRDARYGDGQYMSDIRPGTHTLSQLSRRFVRFPFSGSRFTHYVEVNVADLEVVRCREHVFLAPGSEPLGLEGRLVSWGSNECGISG